MGAGCPRCGATPSVGVLCTSCAALVRPPDGMIPDHVASHVERTAAAGWLIDGFGTPHPIATGRTLIGRRPQADVVVLAPSVSRDHAELTRVDGSGWQIRDLGSRNATTIDGQRVQGRAPLQDGMPVRFGEVPFLFVGRALPLDRVGPRSIETAHAADATTFRYTLRGDDVDLCLLGSTDAADVGGALLYRNGGGEGPWAELSLPPLEFQLLRALASRAITEAGSPSRSRGCVPTKQLAKDLPFQSRYANDENVRQVVRRLRTTLDKVGAGGLVEALPGRGYYITWTVLDS
jgi:hypothetical protein